MQLPKTCLFDSPLSTSDPWAIYKSTHVGHFVSIQDDEGDYQTSVNSCEIETHPGLDSERPLSDLF